jgi:hypothetical protein
MKIFNHRGQERGPQNISQEIDIRFQENVGLVLTHDIGSQCGSNIKLCDYVQNLLKLAQKDAILALNIKEDGLAPLLKKELKALNCPLDRVFCFDMAQSEIPQYIKERLPIATRASLYGIEHPMGKYIWFDWYPHVTIHPGSLLTQLKIELYRVDAKYRDYKIIAVSPELHGETKKTVIHQVWSLACDNEFFGVCTDFVEEAERFFNEDTCRTG